jgi:undecaprenyl pyrophosphate synthase
MSRLYLQSFTLARVGGERGCIRRARSLGRALGAQRARWPRHVVLLVPPSKAPHLPSDDRRTLHSLIETTLEASSFGVRFLTIDGCNLGALRLREPQTRGRSELFEAAKQSLVSARVRLKILGEIDELATPARHALEELQAATAHAPGLTLTLAVTEPGRSEIVEAARALAARVRAGLLLPEEIDAASFRAQMGSGELPPVDLLMRWAEARPVGDFLPFETRYACELTPAMPWRRFRAKDLALAIHVYRRTATSRGLGADRADEGRGESC